MQLLTAIVHAQPIPGVDNPHNGIGLFKVILPIRSQGALTTDIPCREGVRTWLGAAVKRTYVEGVSGGMRRKKKPEWGHTYLPWTRVFMLNPNVGLTE